MEMSHVVSANAIGEIALFQAQDARAYIAKQYLIGCQKILNVILLFKLNCSLPQDFLAFQVRGFRHEISVSICL